MNKGTLIGALALCALPTAVFAQAAPPPTIAPAPVDPARLAAARPVIDHIWPTGTYARVMNGAMEQMTQSTLAGMYNMKASDLIAGGAPGKTDAAQNGKTMGDILAAEDPYFEQRMKITMSVMMDKMTRLMTEIEPNVRDAMAHSYARRFTVAQLTELNGFFSTPTGSDYAKDAMLLMMGPDMTNAMQSFTPRLMREFPAIMAKVKDATKNLPPPPKHTAKP